MQPLLEVDESEKRDQRGIGRSLVFGPSERARSLH